MKIRGYGVVALLVLSACRPHQSTKVAQAAGVQAERPPAEGELERSAMQLDLDFWLATLTEVHPDPYTKIERSRFLAEFAAAREALPEHADALYFYATLQRLAARLQDSHTRVHHPESSRAYNDAWWPIQVAVRDGRLFVERTERGLVRGTELLSVNQWSAARLLQGGAALSNAETSTAAQHDAPWAFSVVLWEAGIRGPFSVRGRLPSGATVSALVEGIVPYEAEAEAEAESEDFSLSWPEHDVALLTLRAMTDVDGFASFVESAVEQLAAKHARALIVDLRENSGGNTEVGERLLERVTAKPYTMVGEKHWRVSKQYQARAHYQEYLDAKPGTTLHFRWKAEAPSVVSARYDGPVCFLIGPNTVSSAMMLANAVEDFDLGLLIGEPTSSPPNYFGEVYRFDLPRTKLRAQSSVARFVRANGNADDPNPVQPDIRVSATLEQWARGDDAVLARALEWSRSGK
mgnify:CR=1 FL=1